MESDKEPVKGRDSTSPDYPNAYTMPRGIEVLVKKASVDTEFRKLLLEKRAEAAREIDLELDEAEKTMLAGMPREQLVKIIDNTKVPPEQKKVFLSSVGRIMLASVIAGSILTCTMMPSLGHNRSLSPEQRDRILQRQKERENKIDDINKSNQVDLKAEADSND